MVDGFVRKNGGFVRSSQGRFVSIINFELLTSIRNKLK